MGKASALAMALAMGIAVPARAASADADSEALDSQQVAQPTADLTVVPPWPTTPAVRHYGIEMDAGAPEGATASIVVRPVRMLRLHAGAGYNGISTGVQGGATFVPFRSWFTPTLSADYGAFPDGDATWLVHFADPTAMSPVLHRIGYRYANARLGLEFGRKRATFYLQAGVSLITGTVHDAASELGDSDVMVSTTNPRIEAWTVSARIGWIVYFGP